MSLRVNPYVPGRRSYFQGAYVVTGLALAAGFLYGALSTHSFAQGLAFLVLTGILCVLEITLSFDNAVVNATILKNWPAPWRRAFLIFGILFAVAGMRLLLPIILVMLTTHQGVGDVFKLAFGEPLKYAALLSSSKYLIEAFGGAFLAMIALEFFLDAEKDEHWVAFIESKLTSLGQVEAVQAGVTLAALTLATYLLAPAAQREGFFLAGVLGIIGFVATKALGTLLGGEAAEAGKKIVQATVFGFLYLEVLDASFSFDGVMGAFAITTSLPVIMLGLGAGAYWVRSLTIWLVDHDKLAEYRYLAHGAYWAIAVLAGIMFVSVRYEVPDLVTGLIGAVLIGLAYVTSVAANRRDAEDDAFENEGRPFNTLPPIAVDSAGTATTTHTPEGTATT